jgi:hypothetical protein
MLGVAGAEPAEERAGRLRSQDFRMGHQEYVLISFGSKSTVANAARLAA